MALMACRLCCLLCVQREQRVFFSTASPSQSASLVHKSLLGSSLVPQFLFVYRAWSNPAFPEMFCFTEVACHEFLYLDYMWLWRLTVSLK